MAMQIQPQCCCPSGHEDPPGSGDCETNCTPGTIPNTFDCTANHSLWFTSPDSCQYTGGVSPYGGAFETQWLGETDGICRWYYCGDDPCAVGKKFVWTQSYRLPDLLEFALYYGCDITACDQATVLGCLNAGIGVAGGYDDFDTFRKAGQTETNCCLINQGTIAWVSGTGGARVTLGGGARYLTTVVDLC